MQIFLHQFENISNVLRRDKILLAIQRIHKPGQFDWKSPHHIMSMKTTTTVSNFESACCSSSFLSSSRFSICCANVMVYLLLDTTSYLQRSLYHQLHQFSCDGKSFSVQEIWSYYNFDLYVQMSSRQ